MSTIDWEIQECRFPLRLFSLKTGRLSVLVSCCRPLEIIFVLRISARQSHRSWQTAAYQKRSVPQVSATHVTSLPLKCPCTRGKQLQEWRLSLRAMVLVAPIRYMYMGKANALRRAISITRGARILLQSRQSGQSAAKWNQNASFMGRHPFEQGRVHGAP